MYSTSSHPRPFSRKYYEYAFTGLLLSGILAILVTSIRILVVAATGNPTPVLSAVVNALVLIVCLCAGIRTLYRL
jgi:hypothetical protein